LTIDAVHAGIIPWERRKGIGYFQSFFRTLATATFEPKRLAQATGAPIDLRSACLFRWVMRALIIVPCVSLFALDMVRMGGLSNAITMDGPSMGGPEFFWEPHFLWTVGATFWPTLPIGFALGTILATGISHWLFMKHLEPVRQHRAMALSFYLCAPLGWILIPCLVFGATMILSDSDWVGTSRAIDAMAQGWGLIGVLCGLVQLLAMANSVRAINAATQCGLFRSLKVGAGIVVQIAISFVIGLGLFPMTVGLFRLMIISLWR
jgi:hypothetical protein